MTKSEFTFRGNCDMAAEIIRRHTLSKELNDLDFILNFLVEEHPEYRQLTMPSIRQQGFSCDWSAMN